VTFFILTMKQIFVLILTFNIYISFAQNEKKVEGTFQTEVYGNETIDLAKKRAKEGAIINALEKAFGTAVFQGNTLFIKNITTGNQVETKTGFNTIADTYVKGEVVEELESNFTEFQIEKKINKQIIKSIGLKCDVKIIAREYIEPEAEFISFAMNCEDTAKCKTTQFRKKDDFFLYFNSPKKGYLAVFLDDNETSSLLFPYVTFREKYFRGFPVQEKKTYLLFSNDKKYKHDNLIVDELIWDSRENMEKLILIFSPQPFELLDLSTSKIASIPLNTNSSEFNKWLIHLRKKSKNLEIKKIALSTLPDKY
jgi:hypothetical protein